MPRRNAPTKRRWLKLAAWAIILLALLAVAGLFAGQAWLNRYLRSPEFRATLEERTGRGIRAQVQIDPLRIEGNQFFCDRFTADGAADATFSAIRMDGLRGDVAVPSILRVLFGDRTVRIDTIDIQRLDLDFYNQRIPLQLPPRERTSTAPPIGSLSIRDLRIAWPMGGLTGARLRVTPAEGGGWRAESDGGRLTQLGMPGADVGTVRLVVKEPSLFIQQASLRVAGGEIAATGEVTTRTEVDLLFTVTDVDSAPFLPERWHSRLRGRLHGEARIRSDLSSGAAGATTTRGHAEMRAAVLEALPVLDHIARFTRTDRFRRLQLDTLRCEYSTDSRGIRITALHLEARQLLKVTGDLTIRDGRLEGQLQLGVTPGPLQLIPGAQEKVFTTAREGYVWTPVCISGTPEAPTEDLSQRLLIAMGESAIGTAIQTARDAAGDASSKAIDAAGGVLDAVKERANSVFDLLLGN